MERLSYPLVKGSSPERERLSSGCSPSFAVEAATRMFGCWRRVDAADPETFVAGVSAVLSDYPEHVVTRVTDPRTGLPGRQPFPPSPYEVKQACEAEMAPIRRQMQREATIAASRALPAPEMPKPSHDELVRKLGPTWGIRQTADGAAPLSKEAVVKAAKERLAEMQAEAEGGLQIEIGPKLRVKLDAMRDDYARPVDGEGRAA